MITENLFAHFEQRLTSVGGECHQVERLEDAALLIARHSALQAGELIVPPSFEHHPRWGKIIAALQNEGIHIREASDPASAADAPAGLSAAELAIAETGSVLMAENSLEARIVGMLTLTHFVLVHDLVPMLEAAAELLQQLTTAGSGQRHYISLITGPSRTADIERTLTIGVQGPKALCVLFITGEGVMR